MLKDYNYIKYPEDRLYLRVGNLCRTLSEYLVSVRNIDAYEYLRRIKDIVKPDADVEVIKRTEKHLISNDFINQNCFTDIDRQNILSIIREYKLRTIL